jgi:hypothetical protein
MTLTAHHHLVPRSWTSMSYSSSPPCASIGVFWDYLTFAFTHWIGGWVGLRAGLDTEARGKTLCLCQGLNAGHPVCSQTLYWLSYPSLFSTRDVATNMSSFYFTCHWKIIWSSSMQLHLIWGSTCYFITRNFVMHNVSYMTRRYGTKSTVLRYPQRSALHSIRNTVHFTNILQS